MQTPSIVAALIVIAAVLILAWASKPVPPQADMYIEPDVTQSDSSTTIPAWLINLFDWIPSMASSNSSMLETSTNEVITSAVESLKPEEMKELQRLMTELQVSSNLAAKNSRESGDYPDQEIIELPLERLMHFIARVESPKHCQWKTASLSLRETTGYYLLLWLASNGRSTAEQRKRYHKAVAEILSAACSK